MNTSVCSFYLLVIFTLFSATHAFGAKQWSEYSCQTLVSIASKSSIGRRAERAVRELENRVFDDSLEDRARLTALNGLISLQSRAADALVNLSTVKSWQETLEEEYLDQVEGTSDYGMPVEAKLAARATFWDAYLSFQLGTIAISGLSKNMAEGLVWSFADAQIRKLVFVSTTDPSQGFTELGETMIDFLVTVLPKSPRSLAAVKEMTSLPSLAAAGRGMTLSSSAGWRRAPGREFWTRVKQRIQSAVDHR